MIYGISFSVCDKNGYLMKQLSENMSLTFVKTMHRTFITVMKIFIDSGTYRLHLRANDDNEL